MPSLLRKMYLPKPDLYGTGHSVNGLENIDSGNRNNRWLFPASRKMTEVLLISTFSFPLNENTVFLYDSASG